MQRPDKRYPYLQTPNPVVVRGTFYGVRTTNPTITHLPGIGTPMMSA